MSPERGPINVVDTVVDTGLLGPPLHHHDFEVFSTCSPKASLRPPGAQPTTGSKGNTGRTVAQGARASP